MTERHFTRKEKENISTAEKIRRIILVLTILGIPSGVLLITNSREVHSPPSTTLFGPLPTPTLPSKTMSQTIESSQVIGGTQVSR